MTKSIILIVLSSVSTIYRCYSIKDSTIYKSNSLTVRIGFDQKRENNLHLIPFKGVCYHLEYNHSKYPNSGSQFSISLRNSFLKTKFEKKYALVHADIKCQYSYLLLTKKIKKIKLHSGPGFGIHYNSGFYRVWDDSHLYWSNYLGFKLDTRLVKYLNKNRSFTIAIQVPLVMFISRPSIVREYKMDDFNVSSILKNQHKRTQFSIIGKSLILGIDAEYSLKKTSNHSKSIVYSVSYLDIKTDCSYSFQSIVQSLGLKFYL